MLDQATKLRNLVLRASRQAAELRGPAPRLVAMAGGKGGVGATTLALNCAVALAQNGSRVVLVDADLHHADVSVLCGIEEEGSIADVLSARRGLHEVLQRGPAGVLVVPGTWAGDSESDYSDKDFTRLIDQLNALGRHADVVILDLGAGASPLARRFWQAADLVVLATTPDSVAVMDTYATIKSMKSGGELPPIQIAVNQAGDATQAENVWRRIDQSCHRFLQARVGLLGYVPPEQHIAAAATAGIPLLIQSPGSPAAVQIEKMAEKLLLENDHSSTQENAA